MASVTETQMKMLTGKSFPFEEIPVEHQTLKTLSIWLKANLGSLKDLPLHLLTDDLCRVAVRVGQKDSTRDVRWMSAQCILAHQHQRGGSTHFPELAGGESPAR
jgi:hypothetical protein